MSDEPLVTVEELSVWVREEIPPDEPYAILICRAATILVNDFAAAVGLVDEEGIESRWTPDDAPQRARLLVAQVAKRNWLNPTQLTKEGSIGPIGGDTFAEAMAAGMELTEYEKAEIERLVTGDDPTSDGGRAWVMETRLGYGGLQDLHLRDDSAPYSDPIPFLDPGADPYYFPVRG